MMIEALNVVDGDLAGGQAVFPKALSSLQRTGRPGTLDENRNGIENKLFD